MVYLISKENVCEYGNYCVSIVFIFVNTEQENIGALIPRGLKILLVSMTHYP